MEPKCHYCGTYTKFRCRTPHESNRCEDYAAYLDSQPVKMDEGPVNMQGLKEGDHVTFHFNYDTTPPEEVPIKIKGMVMDNVKIEIYMDFGAVYTYYVHPDKAREHADAILKGGYRHTPEGTNDLEWYPPHRIIKVKIENGGESTQYRDEVRAT